MILDLSILSSIYKGEKMVKKGEKIGEKRVKKIISELQEKCRIFQNILSWVHSVHWKSIDFQNNLSIPRVHWLSVQLIVQSKTSLGKMWLSVQNMYTINSTHSEH